MMYSVLSVVAILSLPLSEAFVVSTSRRTTSPQSLLFSAEQETAIEKPPAEEGSHDELMFALGVNLARQLGDIRPLVEDGTELAQVAKGLLDTVIGRFTEEEQVLLLQKRGTELNELIAARAYVYTGIYVYIYKYNI
jgi:hypothetical protein